MKTEAEIRERLRVLRHNLKTTGDYATKFGFEFKIHILEWILEED